MKKIFVLIICSLISIISLAQYGGSSGDGQDHGLTVWVGLDGVPGNSNVLFWGGNGDGHSSNNRALIVGDNMHVTLYNGGKGDGYALSLMQGFINGINASQLFTGGDGDGHALLKSSSFVNGSSGSALYGGNIGDGFGSSKFGGFLNNVSIWNGGFGDGHHLARYGGFLETVLIYGGGDGDGVTFSLFSGEFPDEAVVGIIDEFQKGSNNTTEFDIYPNPTIGNSINISFVNKPSSYIQIDIFNMNGKKVFKKMLKDQKHESLYQLEGLEKLAAGTYIIGVTGQGFKASKVLIIAK